MNRTLKLSLAVVALAGLGFACSTEPETLGVKSFEGEVETDSTPAAEVDESAETEAAQPAEEEPAQAPKSKASTCDVAREAFLTGSPAEITQALQALQRDTTADATAREYADYYVNRDAGQPDMQEMDKGLIQMSCSGSGLSWGDDASGSKPSTCDVAREAFLTGSAADITAALQALQSDTTADATAREYADYYLHRDAGDPDMQDMDKGLIRMSCS